MSKKILRPYQEAAIEEARREMVSGHKAVIIYAPTGAGKTVIASDLIRRAQARNSRIIFLAHRKELIEQCSERLADNDIHHGIIKSGVRPTITARVQVASVQTLVRREFDEPELLFIDECHHARASTYHRIIEKCPRSRIIGLTASPCRTDGKGLGDIFDSMVQVTTTKALIEEGFLVPFRVFSPTKLDLSGVRTTGGDYNQRQLDGVVRRSSIYGDIIKEWFAKAADRLTVVFAVSVAHSLKICEAFRAAGVRAEHVDGDTPDDRRAEILADLRAGKIQIVSNCGILTEGWDCPPVSCLIVARPTASLALHLQIVGRGLRTDPCKVDCIILDHAGNHARHGFATDNREWSLAGVERRASSEGKDKAPSVRICPKCYLCHPAGTASCPCGHEWVVEGRKPEHRSSDLQEITKNDIKYRTSLDPLTFFTRKVITGEQRGYKPGWARHQFQIVFGRPPLFDAETVEIRKMELTWTAA